MAHFHRQIFIAVLCTALLSGCQAPPHKHISTDTLSASQRQAWEQVQTEWSQQHKDVILAKYGIRLDCRSCSGCYIDIDADIDAEGHITSPVRSDVILTCDDLQPGQKDKIIATLKADLMTLRLPASFAKTHLTARLGRTLKC